MTKAIVSAYSALLDIILFVFLLVGAAVAYNFIPNSIFTRDLYEFKEIIKILIGAAGVFILEVLLIGPFLVLEDIRQAVRAIDRRLVDQAKASSANTGS
jgi:hypothetical protein